MDVIVNESLVQYTLVFHHLQQVNMKSKVTSFIQIIITEKTLTFERVTDHESCVCSECCRNSFWCWNNGSEWREVSGLKDTEYTSIPSCALCLTGHPENEQGLLYFFSSPTFSKLINPLTQQ